MSGLCVFCEKVSSSPTGVVAFEPLNPVAPGHVLIVPTQHVEDFAEDPEVTARVMRFAAQYAAEEFALGQCNLITSRGIDATQSVFHLHVHLVPRWHGDGLILPWSASRAERVADVYEQSGAPRGDERVMTANPDQGVDPA